MYDMFLSYNRRDAGAAEEITNVIERAGFRVFFDKHVTQSGNPSLDAYLKDAIRDSRCFALLHGKHCLGETQKKEADFALSQAPSITQDFRNVMLVPSDECDPKPSSRCALLDLTPYTDNHRLIEGSHFELPQKLLEWLQRVEEIGVYQLRGFDGGTRPARLYRISQPDILSIVPLDWRTFEALLANLLAQFEQRRVSPDAILGISGSGLVIASFIAHKLDPKPPIGYLKHEGPPENRRVVKDHCALPKIPDGQAALLLVDSELKTGSALKLIVDYLKLTYPHAQLSYATLCAQLSDNYQKPHNDGFLPRGRVIGLKDLLAAQCIGESGLREVFFGGLFGEGRINFLRDIK